MEERYTSSLLLLPDPPFDSSSLNEQHSQSVRKRMPLQLETGEALPSYGSSFLALFSVHPDVPRSQLARQLVLRSVRLHFARAKSRAEEEEQLSGFERGKLPLRVRPAFLLFNVLALLLLGILGFHPRAGDAVPLNDKILHFLCFFFATGLFYCIWDIDEPARRVWLWRNMPLLLTWFICFFAGGIGSEFVQSVLPYKTFQWGDVLANLLGSGLGLFVSFHAEKRHRLRREIERLYEPLDQELYGDDEDHEGELDDDEGSAHDPWRNVDPLTAAAKSAQRLSNGNEGKQARLTSAQKNGAQPTSTGQDGDGPPPLQSTLFSIEDDDDDAGADAWRDAR